MQPKVGRPRPTLGGAGATIATYEFVDVPPDEIERHWPILIVPAVFLIPQLLMEKGFTKLAMVGCYLPVTWTSVESYLVGRFPHRKDDDQIRRRAGVAWMIGGVLAVASYFLRDDKQNAPIFYQIYLPICGIIYIAIGIVMWIRRSGLATHLKSNVLELCEAAIHFERAYYPWANIQSVEKQDKGTHVSFKLWATPLRIFGELNRPTPRPIQFMIAANQSQQFVEHLIRHAKQAKFKGELRIVSADLNARPIEFSEA